MAMEHMMKQRLALYKKGGGRVKESIIASVQDKIYINDLTLPVEEGDIFEDTLPSGLTRRMEVTKVKVLQFGSSLDHLEIDFRNYS